MKQLIRSEHFLFQRLLPKHFRFIHSSCASCFFLFQSFKVVLNKRGKLWQRDLCHVDVHPSAISVQVQNRTKKDRTSVVSVDDKIDSVEYDQSLSISVEHIFKSICLSMSEKKILNSKGKGINIMIINQKGLTTESREHF